MTSATSWAKKYSSFIFVMIVLSCAALNDGFMGTDEYWTGINRYLPAQSTNPMHFLQPDDVKSPLQMIPFWVAAKGVSLVGVDNPYSQYRWMLVILGLFHALLFLYCLKRLEKNTFFGAPVNSNLLVAFFFYVPFVLTRPMFESLAAPWLALSGIFALEYANLLPSRGIKSLLLGVTTVSLAFLLRPQVGLCALVFPIISIRKRDWKGLSATAIVGIFWFILIGALDSIFVGKFHGSLLANMNYNFQHGSEYGKQSALTYPLLLIGVGFIPWLLYKTSPLFQKNYWQKTWPLWVIVSLFVFTHSLISQKFERFLVPLLLVYLMALIPVFQDLSIERSQRPGRYWSLVIVNAILWLAVTWSPPQKNIIDVATYLETQPQIRNVALYKGVPDWLPEIFINRPEVKVDKTDEFPPCDPLTALVVAQGYQNEVPATWKLQKTFDANPLDTLTFKMNPSKNLRRAPLQLWTCAPRL